jgi:FkbM family methyltransferase
MERLGARPRRFFGLDGLDVRLAEHLKFRGGLFVEAGANDGISQSNTAYYERYLGWRGILIEPIPTLAAQCKRNRPRAIVEQCALVPFEYDGSTIEMIYCNLMSLVRGARGTGDRDDAHIVAGCRHLSEGDAPYCVTVPARTLTSVLDSLRVPKLDFLSLDVEGYEGQVLRGLDFDRYTPKYILVEANDPEDVENGLGDRYDLIAQLSHHDRLYRAR